MGLALPFEGCEAIQDASVSFIRESLVPREARAECGDCNACAPHGLDERADRQHHRALQHEAKVESHG
jgi:hypothetical protein